jgi:hypothetical protein
MIARAAVAAGLAGLFAVAAAAQVELVPPQQPKPAQVPAKNPFLPFDRAKFEAAAKELGANEAQLAAFAAALGEVGAARAADDLLRSVLPAFDAAVKQHETGDAIAALELTKVLAETTSPLLRAHVRYHLARLFLDSDDPEQAVTTLNDYFEQDINTSPLDAEAAFFYAQALAELPMPDAAMNWYRGFLANFPDASERFRSAAHQRLGEIQLQQESRLHQLADGMKKTTRDLRRQKTDKPVQVDQEKYLEELDALIEEFQQRESQSSGSPSGLGPSQAPANESKLVEGEGTVGSLNKRPSLVDRWGDMKDAEREKIEAKVNKGLPPQFRKSLGDYYKKLSQTADKK